MTSYTRTFFDGSNEGSSGLGGGGGTWRNCGFPANCWGRSGSGMIFGGKENNGIVWCASYCGVHGGHI